MSVRVHVACPGGNTHHPDPSFRRVATFNGPRTYEGFVDFVEEHLDEALKSDGSDAGGGAHGAYGAGWQGSWRRVSGFLGGGRFASAVGYAYFGLKETFAFELPGVATVAMGALGCALYAIHTPHKHAYTQLYTHTRIHAFISTYTHQHTPTHAPARAQARARAPKHTLPPPKDTHMRDFLIPRRPRCSSAPPAHRAQPTPQIIPNAQLPKQFTNHHSPNNT